MRKSLFAAAFAALTLTAPAFARDASPEHAPQPPAGLTAPLRAGFQVHKQFIAASGLTGWVLQSPDGQYHVFYTTADGQHMIAGALVSSAGVNLTERYTEQYVPKPDLSALWEKFERSNYIVAGEKKNPKSVIYAFLDVNCVFCHYLYLALKPYEAAGLQVRWIPVGFLREDSAAKAAAVLEGGEAVLEEYESKFGQPDAPKGIPVTPELKAKIDANQALMREAQVTGTPGIFYKDASGNVLRRDGMPMLSDLPTITGLPEQPQTDERLNRFR